MTFRTFVAPFPQRGGWDFRFFIFFRFVERVQASVVAIFRWAEAASCRSTVPEAMALSQSAFVLPTQASPALSQVGRVFLYTKTTA